MTKSIQYQCKNELNKPITNELIGIIHYIVHLIIKIII